jgi:glycerol-3-phosphate acyltransferase PlsY
MIEIVVKCAASYLLGSLMGGLIVGRLRGGVDIRELGSGNAGGTNALRTQGGLFAFWVMLIDVGKGFVATSMLAPAAWPAIAGAPSPWHEALPVLCGMAAIIGHIWPIGFEFRGGKGVATVIGAVLGLNAWLLLPILATWLIVVVLTGYVSLGSIAGSLALPLFVGWSGFEPLGPLLMFGVAVAALIVFTHRANISRIRARTEPRARRLWLLGKGHG